MMNVNQAQDTAADVQPLLDVLQQQVIDNVNANTDAETVEIDNALDTKTSEITANVDTKASEIKTHADNKIAALTAHVTAELLAQTLAINDELKAYIAALPKKRISRGVFKFEVGSTLELVTIAPVDLSTAKINNVGVTFYSWSAPSSSELDSQYLPDRFVDAHFLSSTEIAFRRMRGNLYVYVGWEMEYEV